MKRGSVLGRNSTEGIDFGRLHCGAVRVGEMFFKGFKRVGARKNRIALIENPIGIAFPLPWSSQTLSQPRFKWTLRGFKVNRFVRTRFCRTREIPPDHD